LLTSVEVLLRSHHKAPTTIPTEGYVILGNTDTGAEWLMDSYQRPLVRSGSKEASRPVVGVDGPTVTVQVLLLAPSLKTTLLTPFEEYLVENEGPVPEVGLPPEAVHA
jgi:hypothetical protein